MFWLIVLLRIVSNPFSNVFQKILTRKGSDPLFVIAAVHTLLAPVCLPIVLLHARGLSHSFWINIAIVAVLTVLGNALLVAAMRLSDLSVLGPINAYKAVVSLLPGMLLLGEVPGRAGMAGIALIVAGSYFVVEKTPGQARRNLLVRFFAERGIQLRLAALVVSAVEAVFLKKALQASSPLITFAYWAVLGFAAAVVAVAAMLARNLPHELEAMRINRTTFALLATTTGVMQFCTILSFQGLKVGCALALFQTSTLLTVVLGWRVFRERNVAERLLGAAIMGAGATMIAMSK
jgi:drug/metabolite transporter (DMT)-like permease